MSRIEAVSNIAIVGNGLDLHHGLETSYANFIEKGISFETLQKLENYAKELEYDLSKKDWYDFEELYRQIVIFNLNNLEKKGGLNEENNSVLSKQMEHINRFFYNLRHELQKYLKKLDRENNYYKVDDIVAKKLSEADIILTFNYTKTLEDLYKIPTDKIIHVHGDVEVFPIFGHSNYHNYEDINHNYGFHYLMQKLSKEMHNGNIPTIDMQSGNITKPNNSSKKDIQISHMSNIMFGDKNLQRLIMINKIGEIGNTNLERLEEIYENPFMEFSKEMGVVNYLNINFESKLEINVIGHGLKSDVDLLNKILSENKTINLFNGPKHITEGFDDIAVSVFGVDKEKIRTIEYSW